jgi:hypothetical protein
MHQQHMSSSCSACVVWQRQSADLMLTFNQLSLEHGVLDLCQWWQYISAACMSRLLVHAVLRQLPCNCNDKPANRLRVLLHPLWPACDAVGCLLQVHVLCGRCMMSTAGTLSASG